MTEIYTYLNDDSFLIEERYPYHSNNLWMNYVIDHKDKLLQKFSGNYLIGSERIWWYESLVLYKVI
jgi:hypothetical protein